MIPFISDEDLSAYLGTTVSEVDLNVVIALDAACQQVRDEIGRQVNLTLGATAILNGPGTPYLQLPQRPVVALGDITVSQWPSGDPELVDPLDYTWNVERGTVVRLVGVWPRGRLNTTVIYDHGWALSEAEVEDPIERVPSSIRLVALEVAAAVYRHSTTSPSDAGVVTQRTIGTWSETLATEEAAAVASQALTTDRRRTLSKWRDLRAA